MYPLALGSRKKRKEMLAVLGEISKRGWWRECPAQPAQQVLKPL